MRTWTTIVVLLAAIAVHGQPPAQPTLGFRTVRVLRLDGLLFKDLNKNGTVDPYEDWRLPPDTRAADVLTRMTLDEKAGMMVGPSLEMAPGGTASEQPSYRSNPFSGGPEVLVSPGTSDALYRRHITQFIARVNTDPRTMANWLNDVQRLAEGTRLGIPAFFVTNPRNHVVDEAQFGMNEATTAFSQWPGPLGLAATRDPSLVEEFASIAAREYVAVGIRGAYHPQADLATEPRWNRISGTFGEDATLASDMLRALVRGFQGPTLGPGSVALTVKHFPGGGPAIGGRDSHFASGKFSVYPGKNFDYHVTPFRAAIDAGVAAVMPYYSIPQGQTREEVGNAFNRDIVTTLLRETLGFQGIVNSDSGITTGMPWGVEQLTVKERYKKAIDAGTDLIGSDLTPEYIVDLVKSGGLTEARIDQSVRRILRVRFALGVFENPYANPEEAATIVRSEAFQQKADEAQRKSIVLLKNDGSALPFGAGLRIFVDGVNPAVATRYGYVSAADPAGADVSLFRVKVGERQRPAAGRSQAAGPQRPVGPIAPARVDLTIPDAQLARLRAAMRGKPAVVAIDFDRPYVVTPLAHDASAVLALFGVTDEALLDVVFGRFAPVGKLPFELPSSMDAVNAQQEDVPFDSKDPLFRFGAGLTYAKAN